MMRIAYSIFAFALIFVASGAFCIVLSILLGLFYGSLAAAIILGGLSLFFGLAKRSGIPSYALVSWRGAGYGVGIPSGICLQASLSFIAETNSFWTVLGCLYFSAVIIYFVGWGLYLFLKRSIRKRKAEGAP